METAIQDYIADQPADRRKILSEIHDIIIKNDTTVTPVIEPMMGREMIIYKCNQMKYGLASVKQHMSLHVLPIYGSPELHTRYKILLPGANFQKGCINFTDSSQMPLPIVRQLIKDCAKIDLQKIREEYLANKKTGVKKNKKM